jgi:hypothetical protein
VNEYHPTLGTPGVEASDLHCKAYRFKPHMPLFLRFFNLKFLFCSLLIFYLYYFSASLPYKCIFANNVRIMCYLFTVTDYKTHTIKTLFKSENWLMHTFQYQWVGERWALCTRSLYTVKTILTEGNA